MTTGSDNPPPSPPPPPPPPSPPPPPPPAPPANRDQEIADARAEAAARRIEAKNNREEADRVKGELEQYRAAEPQRVEAAVAPLRERETRISTNLINAELKAEALGAGLVDADLLPLIRNTELGARITYNAETGAVTGIAEAVADFKAKKPTYFIGGTPPGPRPPTGSGHEPPPAAPGVKLVKDMTPAEYKVHKAEELKKLRR